MTYFLEHEEPMVGNRQGILMSYENLRQCTVLLRLINNKLTGYRDFLSGGANILAVSYEKWHMSFKFMVLEYIENSYSYSVRSGKLMRISNIFQRY